MTDKQHLRTWELHPRFALMKEQLRKETWTPYTWSFANSKCGGGGMWVSRSKFFSQFISCLGIGVYPRILPYKKWKKMRGVAMVTTLNFHHQTIMVSTLNVLLLTLNKALTEGRPRITRYVLMPISLWIKLNHVSLLPLSVRACSSLNVFDASHIHWPFKSSMVFGLKCPLQSN